MKKPKNAEEYIDRYPQWESSLNRLREYVLQTGMEETIKWMFPVYMHTNENVCALAAGKEFYGLWFFQGALLSDPNLRLVNAQEGKTQAMRHLRFTDDQEYDEDLIAGFIYEAIENARQGKKVERKKKIKKEQPFPEELNNLFRSHTSAEMAFEKFSKSQKREFIEYITTAKQKSTRLRRAEKCIQFILRGEGLNDRYRKK